MVFTEEQTHFEKDLKLEKLSRLDLSITLPRNYPKSVFLIIFNELCERFSYYGIRAIMFLYLTSKII